MKKKIAVWLSIFILSVAGIVSANKTYASEEDERAVKKAVAEFYNALNSMFTGDLDLMKEV